MAETVYNPNTGEAEIVDEAKAQILVNGGWTRHPSNDLTDTHTRSELNRMAADAGVEDPESLPNKQAVADAIDATE